MLKFNMLQLLGAFMKISSFILQNLLKLKSKIKISFSYNKKKIKRVGKVTIRNKFLSVK